MFVNVELKMITNKGKILQAATTLLLEKGLAGMSVRAIAKLAGVSTIGIYSHFQGKQGILDALYIEGYQHVGEAMLAAIKIADPKAAAVEGARLYALRIWALVHGYVSLQHHAVRDVVMIDDWDSQALAAVVIMIDSIAAEH